MVKRRKQQQPNPKLTWIGKEERTRSDPHVLVEDQELSYHAPKRVSEKDIFDNVLIHGDNLLALKALEHDFAGQVKCIYIDPPYNLAVRSNTTRTGLSTLSLALAYARPPRGPSSPSW